MDIKKLQEVLSLDQVEFREQSVSKYGVLLLVPYKDSRVDMSRLDEVCTPMCWKREHTRDNKNCVVSIWCDNKNQWISKEDTGSPSKFEPEKGLASDSFKRACTNWGIGRELYDYPVIKIQLNNNEYWEMNQTDRNGNKILRASESVLRLNEWKWYGEYEENKITFLAAQDANENTRFQWGERKK